MKKLLSIRLFLLFIPLVSLGQKVDNTASFRDIKSTKYLRLNYENDVFASTDRDYTQGINLEWVSPIFKSNPLNHIFILPKQDQIRYGLDLEHIGFTADSLESFSISYGDRPFAGVFMAKSFAIATDTINKSRITTSLSIGIIGPGAGFGNMQREMHKIIGSLTPNGWYYQIKNDLVLNYDISYEKLFFRSSFFSLAGNADAKLGTLFTNASVGCNATLGIINSPFSPLSDKNKFQLYAYGQPLVNFIGYDATLQGGMINRNSVYTIPDSDIERVTSQLNMGLVLQYERFYLEYSYTLLTREINTASPHPWGGMRLGYNW